MTITTELRKLIKTMTGKDATGQTIDELVSELNDNYTGGGGGGGSVPIYWGTQDEDTFVFDLTFQELKDKIDEVGTVIFGVNESETVVVFQTSYAGIEGNNYISAIYGISILGGSITPLIGTISGAENDTVSFGITDIQPFIDSEVSDTSTNPVENRVIKNYIDEKATPSCVDVTATLSGTTLTADITHGDLQGYMHNQYKTVRLIIDINMTVYSIAIGYNHINDSSNVAYFLSLDGQNNTPTVLVSESGALTDNITFTVGS